jgi:FkbM family methyltransferase
MIDSVTLSDSKFSTKLFFEKAKLFFNLSKFNILHIGAYLGEEVEIYKRYTKNKIYLVEGNSRIFLKLKKIFKKRKKIYLLNKIISGKPQKKNFFIYKFRDSFKSSSLLEINQLKKISNRYSGVEAINVQTSSINDILNKIDILVLDTQGVELEILKSIKKKSFFNQIL